MRKLLIAVAALSLMVGAVPAAGIDAPAAGPGPGYIATDNVEWLANIPLNADSAGARIHGEYLYVTEDRGLTIYDISDPELPVPTGFTPLPQQAYFTEEDVDTNGEILLIGSLGDLTDSIAPLNRVFVIDVRDKTMPKILSWVDGANAHTITCVNNCTYAYGSNGKVIDLRDPANPVLTTANWTMADGTSGVRGSHDVTEVSPGIVLSSSSPMLLLDARTDPLNPTVIGSGEAPSRDHYMHGNLWPRGGTDKFMLAGSEASGDCTEDTTGAFMTYTHATDPATGQTTFTKADEFKLQTGLPTEGNSPYDQYCAHWFSTHPTYADGGLVAMGWYEHGTRFLDIDSATGKVTEKGWFWPAGGSTSAAYWVNDEIVYSVDYQRGIDILRFTDTPATGTTRVAASPGYKAPNARPPLAPALRAAISRDPYACPLPGA